MTKADGGPLDDGGGHGEVAHSARFFGRNAAGDTVPLPEESGKTAHKSATPETQMRL